MTEEEELRALEEIRACLERAYDDVDDELSIWRSAYVPQHWGPAVKAFGMALQCVVDGSASSLAAFARAEGIYNSAILANLANPETIGAAPLMKESLERARVTVTVEERRAVAAEKQETTMFIWMMVVLGVVLVAIVIAAAMDT